MLGRPHGIKYRPSTAGHPALSPEGWREFVNALNSEARAVSQGAEVVVGNIPQAGQPDKAFRWTCYNGMESIEQLLVDSGAGFRDLTNLTTAIAVSADGTVIAGNGIDTNGVNPRAWRAVLPLPVAPTLQMTPSTNMTFSGPQGGGFSSGSSQFQFSRSGGTNSYAITGLPNWLSVDHPTGSMTNTPTTVNFAVNANANGLANGKYGPFTITITFTNANAADGVSPPLCTLGTQTRTVTLNVGGAQSTSPPRHDLNGGGKSDQWRDTSGNTAIWLMNGAAVATTGGFVVPTAWSIVGQHDFNGGRRQRSGFCRATPAAIRRYGS